MPSYEKQVTTIEQQLNLLEMRGLKISNRDKAKKFLTYVSYFRFCLYADIFLDERYQTARIFKRNTSFDKIILLYSFDQEFRLLITDALEKIEIAVRTVITNYMALNYGSVWMLNHNLFKNPDEKFDYCEDILKKVDGEINRAKLSDFISGFYKKYTEISSNLRSNFIKKHHPPSWVVSEVLSFGKRILQNSFLCKEKIWNHG